MREDRRDKLSGEIWDPDWMDAMKFHTAEGTVL